MTHPPHPADAFSPHIHGARGLFALMIFAFHITQAERPTYPALNDGVVGYAVNAMPFGVELFFAISGFVILGALHRAPSAGAFLRDRVARIGPVLWASVTFMGAVGVVFAHREFGRRGADEVALGYVASLLALPGILPIWGFHEAAWSISYEFAFYILCAAAVVLQARWGAARAALVWGPAALLLANFYPRGLPFLVGVLVAQGWLVRWRGLARAPGLLLVAFLALWSVIAHLGPDWRWVHTTTLVQWAGDARLPLAVLALACLALAFQGIVDGAGWLGRFLVTRPMLFFGTISYSIYMWHGPMMGGVRHALMPMLVADRESLAAQLLFPVIAAAIVIPVSVVSHRLLEVRASAMLRQWLGAKPRAPTTAAGATAG
jgi:peptidoglycan/LPS O-acetylase OafA/YrhL